MIVAYFFGHPVAYIVFTVIIVYAY